MISKYAEIFDDPSTGADLIKIINHDEFFEDLRKFVLDEFDPKAPIEEDL